MSMHDDIKTVLVSEEQLKAKVAELGAQISRDYAGKNLVLVSILKGSVVFMADLMRAVSRVKSSRECRHHVTHAEQLPPLGIIGLRRQQPPVPPVLQLLAGHMVSALAQ